jgi:hypothetical protein
VPRVLFPILISLLVVACKSTAPPAQPSGQSKYAPKDPIPVDLRASVERSTGLGREIYLQDKAGWIGTDVVLAAVKTLDNKGMGGFLAIREGDETGPLPAYIVIFYTHEETPRIRYQVRVPFVQGQKPSLETLEPPKPVGEDLAMLIRARQAALEAAGPFGHPMNTVVLPDPDGGILVYLLTPATRPRTVVFGKHYRVSVTIKGIVKAVEPLSKGNLEISTAPSDEGQLNAIFVTHLLSGYPLETHVAASLMADLPVMVVTERGFWWVNRDAIGYSSTNVPGGMSEKLERAKRYVVGPGEAQSH